MQAVSSAMLLLCGDGWGWGALKTKNILVWQQRDVDWLVVGRQSTHPATRYRRQNALGICTRRSDM